MSISSIQAGQTAYNPYPTQMQDIKQAESSSYNRTATSDSVQISDKAKQLSQNTPTAESGSVPFDPKNPPLEAFAIPTWAAQYTPPANILILELNHDYFSFTEDLDKRHIPREEQRQMISDYHDNDPFHQDQLKKERFRQQYRNELQEYGEILHRANAKALETNGLTGEFAYYQKVTLDQTISTEKVHQDFRANLLNSPRAIELMRILDIDDAVIEGLSTNS